MKTKKACNWILMTALMISLLAGCGGKAEPDENSGLYKAVTAKMAGLEMEIDDIFDDDVTLELQDGGKAIFTYEGKDYKMKWERSGKKLTAKGGGAELSGTVKDGVMELTDILDSGVDITLECKSIVRKASRADRKVTVLSFFGLGTYDANGHRLTLFRWIKAKGKSAVAILVMLTVFLLGSVATMLS